MYNYTSKQLNKLLGGQNTQKRIIKKPLKETKENTDRSKTNHSSLTRNSKSIRGLLSRTQGDQKAAG